MKKVLLILALMSVLNLSAQGTAQAVTSFYFDLEITANVTQLPLDMWLYEYTIYAGPRPEEGAILRDLSHWWIQLPEEKIPTLSEFTPPAAEVGSFTETEGQFAGTIIGVKWEKNGLITYSFVSTHGPVLNPDGSINQTAYLWYAKDGVGYDDFGYVLGPNGGHVIPEPASLLLMGTGLLAAFFRRKFV